MKHVPRPVLEPPGLAAHRAENLGDVPAGGAAAKAAWERLRDNRACYDELRGVLLRAQGGLCGYCEQRLTTEGGALHVNDQQIEHVLAKAGGAGRTLDWLNMLLGCGGGTYREKDPAYRDLTRHYHGDANVSCGQAKGDGDLPPGCDPRTFPCLPRIVDVGLDGTLSADAPACQAAGIDPRHLDRAINEVLNLNCARLKLARSKVVDNILKWIVPLWSELLPSPHLTSEQAETARQLLVAARLQPDTHGYLRAFWTTERRYLEPDASTWIADNGDVVGCPQNPPQPAPP